ncbi:hypothetical protein COU57_02620 [Candidatus Pacearchaeota archaeon CG10_big_fil_rev_8_21_14_0_10_32_14]|nr:MAG: hypothetical protein COU57_02620 [Candidatus Pacearchaeota archaeon CG10_big_fil_rev_8_21_14_0_10_32_14]
MSITNLCKNKSSYGEDIIREIKKIKSNEQGKIIDQAIIDLKDFNFNGTSLDFYENLLSIFIASQKEIYLVDELQNVFELANSFMKYCRYNDYDEINEPYLIIFNSMAHLQEDKAERGYIRRLIEAGFNSEKILIVGSRNMGDDEIIYAREKRIKLIGMNQIYSNIEDTCDIIMEYVNGKEKKVLLCLDMNIIDPAFAPGVTDLHAGGISSRDIIYFVQRLNRLKNLKGISLSGIDIEKDKKNDLVTIKLGAKIIAEFL